MQAAMFAHSLRQSKEIRRRREDIFPFLLFFSFNLFFVILKTRCADITNIIKLDGKGTPLWGTLSYGMEARQKANELQQETGHEKPLSLWSLGVCLLEFQDRKRREDLGSAHGFPIDANATCFGFSLEL